MNSDDYLVIICTDKNQFNKLTKYLKLVKKYRPQSLIDELWFGKKVQVMLYNNRYHTLGEKPIWQDAIHATEYFRREILTKEDEQPQSVR